MLNRKFLYLFSFYVFYQLLIKFGTSILPTHFLNQHLNLQQILFGTLVMLIGQMVLLITLTKFSSKKSWRLASFCVLFYILLSASILNVYQFYLASFIYGLGLYFFYIFYNIAHFEYTPKNKRGHSSALMFIAPSLIGIIAPLSAGIIAQFNIILLWVISIISFFVVFYFIKFQEDFKISYSLKNSISEIKATRIFIFIEGIWEAMVMGIIPVFTLFFIKTPLNYGLFLTYLAVVSVVANFSLGKLTDRLQKRTIFLYPLTIVMALVTILFTIVNGNIIVWMILVGIIQFLLPLFWNISTAMVVDTHPNLRLAIPGREFVLAMGRIVGLVVAVISFSFEKTPFYIFIILGLIFLLYPILLFWRARITRTYTYL
jgi:MFS family permease